MVPSFLDSPLGGRFWAKLFLQHLQSRLLPGAITTNTPWASAAPWKLVLQTGTEELASNNEGAASFLGFCLRPSLTTRYSLRPPPYFACARARTAKARYLPEATTESLLQACVEKSSNFICHGICFQFSPRADLARQVPEAPAQVGGGLSGTVGAAQGCSA